MLVYDYICLYIVICDPKCPFVAHMRDIHRRVSHMDAYGRISRYINIYVDVCRSNGCIYVFVFICMCKSAYIDICLYVFICKNTDARVLYKRHTDIYASTRRCMSRIWATYGHLGTQMTIYRHIKSYTNI